MSTVSVEVTSDDKLFPVLIDWLSKHESVNKLNHVHVVLSRVNPQEERFTGYMRDGKLSVQPQIGVITLTNHGRRILVERTRLLTSKGKIYESIKMTTNGQDNQILLSLLDEARILHELRDPAHIVVFKSSNTGWFKLKLTKNVRSLHSLVFQEGLFEDIMNDVKDFLGARGWYEARGMPYRRGYLLHGPSGCGKSTLVEALAGQLDYSIAYLDLGDPLLSDDILQDLMNSVPNKSIILIEDIDTAFRTKDVVVDKESAHWSQLQERINHLTFAGLSNILDGVLALTDARIIFMTTNRKEKLDTTLVRAGRVDRYQHIGIPNEYQLRRLFALFYHGVSQALVDDFVKIVQNAQIDRSIAEYQSIFMRRKNTPDAVLDVLSNEKTSKPKTPPKRK